MRTLRTYKPMAQKEHFYDNCPDYIKPGEMYEGEICLYKDKKQLFVWKRHSNPLWDIPLDPIEDRSSNRKNIEIQLKKVA